MAIGQKLVTIKGTEYMLTHIQAGRGVVLMKHLSKLLGPAIGKMVTPEGEDVDVSAIIDAVLDNLDNVDIEELCRRLMTGATRNNMAINFDMEFAGEYDKLYELLKAIVEFNFGSVFQLFGSNDK